MASPKCIGTILVIFVIINLIFYKFRLDKKLLLLDKPDLSDAISGNGPKSMLFSEALRTSLTGNLTSLSPTQKSNLTNASDGSAIKTVLKFKGLDKTSYNAGDVPRLLDALKAIQEQVEKEEASKAKPKKLPDCSPKNLGPVKPVNTDITKIPEDLAKIYPDVYGGLWRPKDCHPIHKTAIIIPYRNRTTNLKIFLNHMHRFLQAQLLDYGVFVIDQADTKRFNRAKLLNVGYVEAQKFHSYDCFILHDVDKVPEDTRNIYTCANKPKHLISQRHTQKEEKYKPGVRVRGLGGIFPRGDEGRYLIIDHHDDRIVNSMKWPYVNVVKQTMITDGLNSLNYTIKKVAVEPLYTMISVIL
ncbi:beta-1,4-galactosyltransferase 4-like isoform X2 [Lineus longissimus]|uniref:beta-1,4-galactosyltransferase 4-like isoform X2 n=1 Tax=Lineus longissimus TaxID=88925 RepID=UPI00315DBCF5